MKRIFVYLLAITLVLPLASQPDNKTPQKPPKITRPVSKPKPTQKPAARPKPKPAPKPAPNSAPKPSPKPPQPRVNQEALSNRTFTANGVSFTMVGVQGGTFQMGQSADGNNETPHSVTLSSYYIGQTEVTQALWKAVMGKNPCEYNIGDNRPVQNVSWSDCRDFIRQLNQLTGEHFRLPTEAEWEFAAKGGLKSQGYTYSGSNEIDDVAWYKDNSGRETHEVATKDPNELGIYDMSGNVEEWCQDWYSSYSSSAQTNPTGTSGSDRVNRGGCWGSYARDCRTADRGLGDPGRRRIYLGLRLVLSE